MMMLSYVLACVLVATTCSATPCHPGLNVRLRRAITAENRMKRSLIAIGASAARALLNGAKFVYTDGLHKVFIKPGGYKKAQADFESANKIKPAWIFPDEGQPQIMGQVGDRQLTLRQNGETGTTVLQISKVPETGFHTTVDPMVDTIIVYTN